MQTRRWETAHDEAVVGRSETDSAPEGYSPYFDQFGATSGDESEKKNCCRNVITCRTLPLEVNMAHVAAGLKVLQEMVMEGSTYSTASRV